MIFFDTETVGLTGPLVTIQWAEDDGPIHLHKVWEVPVHDTLDLISEHLVSGNICGFNLVFDWFQLSKWYNILRRLPDWTSLPNPFRVKELEFPHPDDRCLKPKSACDLMLLARSGKFQYLAKHKDFKIRKVPVRAAEWLTEQDFKLPPGARLRLYKSQAVSKRNDVVDIIGKFEGLSTRLKHLASIIGAGESGQFEQEIGLAPYEDVPDWKPWGGDWLYGLSWLRNKFNGSDNRAREYAIRDVLYTRRLWEHLGNPIGGDDDSELACLVGASHWKGFAIDSRSFQQLLEKKIPESKVAPTSPAESEEFISQHLNSIEQIILTDTKKTTLEEIGRWDNHPASFAALNVLKARRAKTRINTIKKLLAANGIYVGMKILGALSSRMSGDSGLNLTGLPREKEFRKCLTLSFDNELLCGGDFDAFEVSIAEAVYRDEQLTADLTSGQKFHSITGAVFYDTTRESILESKGTGVTDKYIRAKNGFFAWLYGADIKKLAQVLNLETSVAEHRLGELKRRYRGIVKHREQVARNYTPLSQANGPGTAVEWNEPLQYIDSLTGIRRYFDLEYSVLKGLYFMDVPEFPGTIRRTDREQTVTNAVRSSLYSACFSLQGHIVRAALNHETQATGASLTKKLQRKIWDLQPVGINEWKVRPFNSHDEILCPVDSDDTLNSVRDVVENEVEEMSKIVKLIRMDWEGLIANWGEK